MAMVSSGSISLAGSDISGLLNRSISYEFRSLTTSTASLSQYYRGGSYVVNHPTNAPVATTGAISIGSFYSTSKRYAVTITISSNTSNYNLQTSSVSGYTAGWTDVTLAINSGIVVSASAAGGTALTVTGFNSADNININNSGTIQGGGGAGGTATGGAGGHAINLNPASAANVAIVNQSSGIIAGGGGGGGRGMAVYGYLADAYGTAYGTTYMRGGGGGGGAGNPAGSGSAVVGTGSGPYYSYLGSAGAGGSGTTTGGGLGGAGDSGYVHSLSNYYLMYAGAGGAGGARGAAGSGGNQGYLNGPSGISYIPTNGTATPGYPGSGVYGVMQSGGVYGSGGAAGNAILGTNKLRSPFTNSGTVYGPQS